MRHWNGTVFDAWTRSSGWRWTEAGAADVMSRTHQNFRKGLLDMKRFIIMGLVVLGTVTPGRAQSPTLLTPDDFTYQGAYMVALNGDNSTYGQGLASRHVNGELRFLHLALNGRLDEFRLPAALGGKVSTPIRSWDLRHTGALDDLDGIWFEDGKNRLWITSATDYTSDYEAAHIYTMTLNDNGTVANLRSMRLKNIPERRVYGGVQPSPIPGCAYVAGWGGYTSLVMNAGNASVGPTMYCVPEPESVASGATVSAKVVLDAADYQSHRGVRKTLPLNYYDGGDPRPNPATPPTSLPEKSAGWLSPNKQGLGWMVMSDSYYNTGMWIDTGAKRGFVMVLSACGGKCYYMSSSVWSEKRVFEWHIFDPAKLGSNPRLTPASMAEFTLPDRSPDPMSGNTTVRNIGAATYADGSIYLISCGGDKTVYQYACGLFKFAVAK